MIKDWPQIFFWAVCCGIVIFAAVMPSSLSFTTKAETALLSSILGGLLRYFFIPVGYRDIFAALTLHDWRTEKEIRDLILSEKGVPKDGFREIVGPVHHYLMAMHHDGHVRIRPRYDPSGLRSSSPPMEYRLTSSGILLIKKRWVNKPTSPPQAA